MSDEIDFKSPCPVYECFKIGRKDIIYWTDPNCKHHYKLTRTCKIKCNGNNCYNNSEKDLLSCSFKCQNHESQKCSYQALCNALQIASQINLGENQDEADSFFEDLIEALMDQRKKYNIK
jgi:hypothetical protein